MAYHGDDKIDPNAASGKELAQVTGSDEDCAISPSDEIDRLKGFDEQAVRHFKEAGTV